MRDAAHQILDTLRLQNGLYVASPSADYHYIWIRDVCYTALAYLDEPHGQRYEEAYHSLLDIFHPYRWKLEYHAGRRPRETFEYIHPRYHPETLQEITAPWGNAQNDATGAFLYGIGLGLSRGKPMLRNDADRSLIEQFIRYLTTLEYWQDADNGMWEENREVHASSIGACVGGLLMLQPHFTIDWSIVQRGLKSLFTLLPRESASKDCDLAQLSLIYPYRLLPHHLAVNLLERVERQLVRAHGVIRYAGDQYYRSGETEAEWCFGLPWLGLCWLTLGLREKALPYLGRTEQVMPAPGVLPELYTGASASGSTGQANENTPLAWAVSMYIQLFDGLAR